MFKVTLVVSALSEAALLRFLLEQTTQSSPSGSQMTTSHSIMIGSVLSTNSKLVNWNPAKNKYKRSIF